MLRILAITTTALVLLLLGGWMVASLFTGGDGDDPTRRASAITDDQTPERFDPEKIGRPDDLTGMGAGEGGWIQQTDPDSGRLIREFRYQKLDPQAEGEFDVTQPEARLYIAPHRVVRLRSKSGYIVAPDNIPQSGTFRDDVLVQVYETLKGRTPDLSADSPDLAVTLRLDDAKFDTVLGKIDSAGEVRVDAAQATFHGRGLTLVFNEPRQRIDYLQIAEGRRLTYTPKAGRRPDRPAAAAGEGEAGDAPADEAPGEDVQYYRVVFDSAVRVESDGRTIEADKLEGVFAFDRGGAATDAITVSPAMPRAALAALPHTAAALPGWALAQAEADAAPAPAPTGNIVMTWRGPVVIRPLDTKPPVMRGPDDVLLTFTGAPVEVTGEDGEVITCARVAFHQAVGQITATGDELHPLHIDSRELGSVRAGELAMRLNEGRGVLWGKGTLRARPRDDQAGLPRNFTIDWTDRVELSLTTPDEKPAGLKSATFIGDVHVDDRELKMDGTVLRVRFEPTVDGKQYAFAGIDARGDVRAVAEQGSISAQRVELFAEPADGRVRPTLLRAREKVRVSDGEQSIAADSLRVDFAQAPDAQADGAQVADDWAADVSTVLAEGQVVATMADGARVTADRLVADNAKRTAKLTGEPVMVRRDDAQLRVRQLDITEGGDVAETIGPGEFISFADAGDDADHKPRELTVRWTRRMRYHDSGRTLVVEGGVNAEHSDRANEVNQLTSNSLSLKLIDAGEDADGDDQRKLLRTLTARDEVVLLSTRWATDRRDTIVRRLRISGPSLVFDNATERATVVGPGSMLVEDYADHDQDRGIGQVEVSGKGATLFTWTGSLTMDGAKTDIIFDRQVNMTHRPADEKNLIEMQADRLVADMKGLGGIEALSTSEVESLRIDHIEATGSVQVRDAQRLIAAHRLYYDGDDQTAQLDAKQGEQVQVVKLDEPRPIKARRITWDLKRDRLDVVQGGY